MTAQVRYRPYKKDAYRMALYSACFEPLFLFFITGWLIHLRYGFRVSLHHARSSPEDKNSVFFGLL